MEQVRLGATGLHVSRVCLGMMSYGNDSDRSWVLNEQAAEPIMRDAVEGGITFFDTADVYSHGASEVATGRLLRSLIPRDEVVIATKVHGQMTPGPNGRGLSRKHILSAIDASLSRLDDGLRRPLPDPSLGPATPIEETMAVLHDVVRAGKARYIGASSMYAWQFAKAQHVARLHGWTPFVSMQNHYNLLYREEEREMIPQCLDQGVGVLPWSPLARGWLAGTRTREGGRHTARAEADAFADQLYGRPEDFDVIDRLVELAAERGIPPAQMALAWLLHRPGVTAPIVGATKPGHLADALAAADVKLSQDEIERLEDTGVGNLEWRQMSDREHREVPVGAPQSQILDHAPLDQWVLVSPQQERGRGHPVDRLLDGTPVDVHRGHGGGEGRDSATQPPRLRSNVCSRSSARTAAISGDSLDRSPPATSSVLADSASGSESLCLRSSNLRPSTRRSPRTTGGPTTRPSRPRVCQPILSAAVIRPGRVAATRTSPRTRLGWRSANSTATNPPVDQPCMNDVVQAER